MSEWKEYKISELVSLNIIAKPLDGNHGGIHPTTKDYVSKGIPFVMASDINNGNLDLTTCKFLTFEHSSKLKKGFAKEGDVLLTHKASIGRTAIVPKLNVEYIVLTPQVTYYRVLDETRLNNFYLMYYFNSLEFQNLLITFSGSGSTRAYIGITEQLNLSIKLPPIILQKQIAEILSSLDDKIKINNKINQELEALAKTLFNQWFIDFEFPNENGEPYKSSGGEMVDSELGEIPKAWRVDTLEKYVKIINGFAFKSEDYVKCGVKIIRTKNFNENGFLDLNDLAYLTDEKSKNYNNFQLQKYDKLLVMVGASIGKSVIVTSNILPALQNQNMWNFRAKSKEFQAYSNFLTDLIVEQNIGSATGSAREFFRKDFFYSIKIKIPTISLINQFNEIITTIYDKLDVLVIENLELTNLRDTLLPQLISGELEINENNN